ncbi:MAG TPA: 30S ribosomal protein S8 [Planctomycetota bacterium]|nr:30S ribosomal protein S8 [Planctomycetota bacterium]
MSMTDPIADLLTRIRNAVANRETEVEVPASRVKTAVVETLKRAGFIRDWRTVEDDRQGVIRIFLKYGPDGEQIINTIRRVSKPGRRVYRAGADLPKILDGLGVAVVSTNQGMLSDHEARAKKIGGEVVCEVW